MFSNFMLPRQAAAQAQILSNNGTADEIEVWANGVTFTLSHLKEYPREIGTMTPAELASVPAAILLLATRSDDLGQASLARKLRELEPVWSAFAVNPLGL